MNDSSNIWLAIIAISTLVMALVQVGAIIAGAMAARKLQARLAGSSSGCSRRSSRWSTRSSRSSTA